MRNIRSPTKRDVIRSQKRRDKKKASKRTSRENSFPLVEEFVVLWVVSMVASPKWYTIIKQKEISASLVFTSTATEVI